VMASFTIEDFSLSGLCRATAADIAGRLRSYQRMLTL
jgi:hypothetical protein